MEALGVGSCTSQERWGRTVQKSEIEGFVEQVSPPGWQTTELEMGLIEDDGGFVYKTAPFHLLGQRFSQQQFSTRPH